MENKFVYYRLLLRVLIVKKIQFEFQNQIFVICIVFMPSPTYNKLLYRNSKKGFQLLEQTFSSYVQAFDWCKSNRYKYKYHSRTNIDDDLLENKIKRYFVYGCDCHGVDCPNERKLEFHSTGQGTFEILMFERGLHSASSSVPNKKRGIDSRLLEFIDCLCRQNKPSTEIRFAVLQKAITGQWGTIEVPSAQQISNRKTVVKKMVKNNQDSSSSITSLPKPIAATDDDNVWSSDASSSPPIVASSFTNISSSAASNNVISRIASATTDDDNVWSSDASSPPPIVASSFTNAFSSAASNNVISRIASATTDDDYVWSSDASSPPIVAATSNKNTSPIATATTDDDDVWSSYELNTSPDSTLAFLTSYATNDSKCSMSKEQGNTQFDFKSIKEGFLTSSCTQRFEMILQLQMLNNFKNLIDQPNPRRQEEKQPPSKKQKQNDIYTYPNTCIYHDDDNEEEVVYLDT